MAKPLSPPTNTTCLSSAATDVLWGRCFLGGRSLRSSGRSNRHVYQHLLPRCGDVLPSPVVVRGEIATVILTSSSAYTAVTTPYLLLSIYKPR
ncbi:MAG: hypothetical protein ABWK05_05150 [Pyrobaculum sp.]